MADFRTMRTAAALLDASTDSPEVQTMVLSALATLDATMVGAASAQELEAVTVAVVAALRRHARSHVRVAREGAAALRQLARHSAASGAAARAAGGFHALVAAMRAHPSDAAAVGEGCDALLKLGSHDAETRRAAGGAGAIEVLLDVLRAHAAHEGVSLSACDALSQLLLDCAANANRACAAGGLAPITAALRTHTADRDVQLWSCRALTLLVRRSSSDTDRLAALPQADVLTAIRVVVAAMDARPTDAELLNEGGCALNWLCETAEYREAAGAAGAVRALVRALHVDAARADAAEHADALTHDFNALARVCDSTVRNQTEAVAAGAPPLVIAALSTYRAHAQLQRAGVFALSCMAMAPRPDAAAAVAVLEAVVAAMRANTAVGYNKDVQIYGCSAIASTIAMHQGAVEEAAIACGAIEAAVAAFNRRTPRVDHIIFTSAVFALDMLTYTATAAHEDRAVRAGALDAITADGRPVGEQLEEVFMPRLRAAAARHDEAPCAHAACERCAAALRASSAMCALAGCGAKARDGKKALQRCARCRVAAYCGEAHQHSDWARHKRECRALAAARGCAADEA
jgi:hypothetical protein